MARPLQLLKPGPSLSVKESFLRLVVIDNPRALLENPQVFTILGEMVRARQGNFLQTREDFLVIDKHDLIGTHLLIYDTHALFAPRLVAGFRITYESRAREFGLPMPIESLLPHCSPEARKNYEEFLLEKGASVQFNTLFIDPDYTYSRSSLRLSELLFFAVCAYIRSLGINHYVGATNDRLKTDRWMKRAGIYHRQTFSFQHPDVLDPHTLFFIDSINEKWLLQCFESFRHYWESSFEFIPRSVYRTSFKEVFTDLTNKNPVTGKKAA